MKSGFFKIALCGALFMQAFAVAGQVAAIKFFVQIPRETKVGKGVYLAGSFNCWHAADSLIPDE